MPLHDLVFLFLLIVQGDLLLVGIMPLVGSPCSLLVCHLNDFGYPLLLTCSSCLELTAAGITIKFWNEHINVGVWVAVFFVCLVLIQFFGVRGYGEG